MGRRERIRDDYQDRARSSGDSHLPARHNHDCDWWRDDPLPSTPGGPRRMTGNLPAVFRLGVAILTRP
jgi:hypothetical protein